MIFLRTNVILCTKKQAASSHIGLALHRSSSKWHAWFASRLSTWPTTGVSCPTALGAQLTFRLAWCRQHSAVMATELLQPPDLARGTLFQSSCMRNPDITYGLFRRQLKGHLFGKHEHGALWGILNRQSRAERQNTFDWLHILPVRVTISQYKSYSANISHILPARVTISQYKPCSANGSHILPVEVIFCQ